MDDFFKRPKNIIKDLVGLDREKLLYKALPRLMMEIMTKYFRLKIEGEEFLPKKGSGIIIPNHSGYAGFDAFILSFHIHQITKRVAKVLTHPLWFWTDTTSIPATKLGFYEATTENGMKFLKQKDMIILFPEGEQGNFKPSHKSYRLQEFRRGFVRMAIKTQSPIIPTIIIGAEETHINLSQLKFTKYLRGLVLPLPLNILPLPAKWKVKFLEPIHLPYKPEQADDIELVHELASDIRERMQAAMTEELKKRDSVYF